MLEVRRSPFESPPCAWPCATTRQNHAQNAIWGRMTDRVALYQRAGWSLQRKLSSGCSREFRCSKTKNFACTGVEPMTDTPQGKPRVKVRRPKLTPELIFPHCFPHHRTFLISKTRKYIKISIFSGRSSEGGRASETTHPSRPEWPKQRLSSRLGPVRCQ